MQTAVVMPVLTTTTTHLSDLHHRHICAPRRPHQDLHEIVVARMGTSAQLQPMRHAAMSATQSANVARFCVQVLRLLMPTDVVMVRDHLRGCPLSALQHFRSIRIAIEELVWELEWQPDGRWHRSEVMWVAIGVVVAGGMRISSVLQLLMMMMTTATVYAAMLVEAAVASSSPFETSVEVYDVLEMAGMKALLLRKPTPQEASILAVVLVTGDVVVVVWRVTGLSVVLVKTTIWLAVWQHRRDDGKNLAGAIGSSYPHWNETGMAESMATLAQQQSFVFVAVVVCFHLSPSVIRPPMTVRISGEVPPWVAKTAATSALVVVSALVRHPLQATCCRTVPFQADIHML